MKKLIVALLLVSAPLSAHAAIAFDAATNGGTNTTTTSQTYSHTTSGSNRFLVVAVRNIDGGDTVTSVTYAGTAMTRAIAKPWPPNNNTWTYLYYLYNPASGANNVVVTVSSNPNQFTTAAASYTGAAQSGTPDTGFVQETAVTGDRTVTVNVTTANSWLVLGSYIALLADPDGVVNGTQRIGSGGAGNPSLYDSNAAVGSGNQTIGLHWTASDTHAMVALAFAPVAAAASAAADGGYSYSYWW